MPKKRSTMSHVEAREYWDKHGIDEELPGDEEVEVRTSKNLSTMLSLRMDREHIDRLKRLAKEEGVGVTTKARVLLNRALDQPDKQSLLEALGAWTEDVPAKDETGFLVLPATRAEQLGAFASLAAQRAFLEAVWSEGFRVGQEDAEALFKLRELSPEEQPRSRA